MRNRNFPLLFAAVIAALFAFVEPLQAQRNLGPTVLQQLRATESNSRAPSGGVAFDGSSSGLLRSTLTGQNIGTENASLVFRARIPSAIPATYSPMIGIGSIADPRYVANGFVIQFDTDGTLLFRLFGGTTNDHFTRAVSSSDMARFRGREVLIAWVRTAAGFDVYFDGTLVPTTAANAGTPPAPNGTLTSTFLSVGQSGNGGSSVTPILLRSVSLYNLALSAADVQEIYELGGAVPERFKFGSTANLITGNSSNFSGGTGNWGGVSGTPIAAVGGKLQVTHNAGFGIWLGSSSGFYGAGRAVRIRFKHRLVSGTAQFCNVQLDGSGNLGVPAFFPGATETQYDQIGIVSSNPVGNLYLIASGQNGAVYEFDDFELYRLGAIVHLDSESGGIGFQWHDSSSNGLHATLTTTGTSWIRPTRRGTVRSTLSWTATHESKSLLGQRCLPSDAIIERIITKASAASTGSGLTVGDAGNAARFVVANTFTTAKKAHTIASSGLPGGITDNDGNLVLDPDTLNYTGSIQIEVQYSLADGVP
jgi:hypothetical protein